MKNRKTILCYGDSNTFGHIPYVGGRFKEYERWTGILQELLKEEYHIVEEGLSGRTVSHSPKGEEYLNGKDLFLPALLSARPVDIIILMLGTNDLKTVFHSDAVQITKGIEEMLDIIDCFLKMRPQIKPEIILVSPPLIGEDMRFSPYYKDFGDGAREKSKDFAAHYAALAEKRGIHFMDASKVVSSSPSDSLHLEREEHRKLAFTLKEMIDKIGH